MMPRGKAFWVVALFLLGATGVAVAQPMPQALRLKPKVSRDATLPPARFSHWTHNQTYCFSCHPSVFSQTLEPFGHADMNQGRYCATCHNGKRAWALQGAACQRCHVGESAGERP
jgi:c(7)-type cytochrome triheme protein